MNANLGSLGFFWCFFFGFSLSMEIQQNKIVNIFLFSPLFLYHTNKHNKSKAEEDEIDKK